MHFFDIFALKTPTNSGLTPDLSNKGYSNIYKCKKNAERNIFILKKSRYILIRSL